MSQTLQIKRLKAEITELKETQSLLFNHKLSLMGENAKLKEENAKLNEIKEKELREFVKSDEGTMKLYADIVTLMAENQDLQLRAPKPVEYYDDIIAELKKQIAQSDRNWGDLSEKFEGERDAWRWAEVELWIERQNEKITRLRWFGGTMWELMECCPLTGDDKKPFEHYLTDEVADDVADAYFGR